MMPDTPEGYAKLAAEWASTHLGRKPHPAGGTYADHAVRMSVILAKAGFRWQTVVACLLHDVVKESRVTIDDVSDAFTAEIANTVYLVTPDGKTRKRGRFLSRLEKAGPDAVAIVLAENIDEVAGKMRENDARDLLDLADRLQKIGRRVLNSADHPLIVLHLSALRTLMLALAKKA